MPPIPPGIPPPPPLSSLLGRSTTRPSVVTSILATDTAHSSAILATFARSIIPALNASTIFNCLASKICFYHLL